MKTLIRRKEQAVTLLTFFPLTGLSLLSIKVQTDGIKVVFAIINEQSNHMMMMLGCYAEF